MNTWSLQAPHIYHDQSAVGSAAVLLAREDQNSYDVLPDISGLKERCEHSGFRYRQTENIHVFGSNNSALVSELGLSGKSQTLNI